MQHIYKPTSLDEALGLQEKHQDSMLWLAGGTLANRPEYQERFEHYISLEGLSLTGIFEEMHVWHLGAMTRLQELLDTEGLPEALRKAAAFQESRALRNMATLGGQVAAMGALCVPLMAMGAELRLALPPILQSPQLLASGLPEELAEVLYACAAGKGLDIASYLNYMRPTLITCICVAAKFCAVTQQRRNARSPVLATVALCWEIPQPHAESACMGTLTDLRAQRQQTPQAPHPVIVAQGAGFDLQRVPEAEQAIVQGLRGNALEKLIAAELCQPQSGCKGARPRFAEDATGSPEYRAQLLAASIAECAAELDAHLTL